ncbi:hypothetical protein ACFLQ3_01505 [Bacteroidota bacterium]
MKNFILLILTLFFSIAAFSQDYIYLKDYSTIEASIKEVSDYMIRYAKFSDPNGDVLAISTDDVVKVVFASGYTREFSTSAKASSSKKDSYFSLGTGYGRSYGGFGIRVQGRFGKTQGFGVHGGLGFNPTRAGGLCFGFGAKFFYYRWLYLNAQIGNVYHKDYYDYDYWDDYYGSEAYFGISILTGGDFFFGDHIGMNVAIGPTIVPDDGVTLGMDLGFIVKF